MDYSAIHERLIARARGRQLTGYFERHHVQPKCMGGTNDPENIVRLTAEEHYVVHQLLAKIHPEVHGLVVAAVRMAWRCSGRRAYGWLKRKSAAHSVVINTGRYFSPETRAKISAAQRGRKQSPESIEKRRAKSIGRKMPEYAKKMIADSLRGIPHSAERRSNQAAAKVGKKLPPEHRAKIAAANTGRKCPKSPEHREKLSAALKARHAAGFAGSFLGRTHSAETRAKISLAKLGKKIRRRWTAQCSA